MIAAILGGLLALFFVMKIISGIMNACNEHPAAVVGMMATGFFAAILVLTIYLAAPPYSP